MYTICPVCFCRRNDCAEDKKQDKDKKIRKKKEYSNLTMYTVIIADVRQLVKTFFALSHLISLYLTFTCLHCSVFYK